MPSWYTHGFKSGQIANCSVTYPVVSACVVALLLLFSPTVLSTCMWGFIWKWTVVAISVSAMTSLVEATGRYSPSPQPRSRLLGRHKFQSPELRAAIDATLNPPPSSFLEDLQWVEVSFILWSGFWQEKLLQLWKMVELAKEREPECHQCSKKTAKKYSEYTDSH